MQGIDVKIMDRIADCDPCMEAGGTLCRFGLLSVDKGLVAFATCTPLKHEFPEFRRLVRHARKIWPTLEWATHTDLSAGDRGRLVWVRDCYVEGVDPIPALNNRWGDDRDWLAELVRD